MNEIAESLVQQIAIMFLIMLLGFILRRKGLVTEAGTNQLSDLVLYVANPIIIMQSLMMDFDALKLQQAMRCFIFTLIITIIAILLARIRFGNSHQVAQFGIVFSNCGFIGIPLVRGILGQEFVFYLSACNACLVAFMWTYGVLLVSGDRHNISLGKIALNPCILALVLGFIYFAFSYHPAPIIEGSLDAIADLNTGLVMIVLGSYLANCDITKLLRNPIIYRTCGLRLIAIPAITLGILALTNSFPFEIALTIMITFATPSAATTALFAEMFHGDLRLGTGIVAISTVLSMGTMSGVIAVSHAVLA